MELRDLKQLVALGEGAHVEFKHRVPRPERLAKEVVAFANTEGGRVLLGVSDDGTVGGLRDVHEEEFALREALDTCCHPPVEAEIEYVQVSRKREAIVLTVPPSPDRPHYVLHASGDGQPKRTAYVRVEDKSVEATREAVRIMKSTRRGGPVPYEFGKKELLLMRYLDGYGKISVDTFASIAGIPRKRAAHTLVHLTRASVLRHQPGHGEDYFTLAYEV
jgi:predicted HTH transcriptional regulator